MKATIIRSANRKTVAIQVLSSQSVVVKAPLHYPAEKIKKLLQTHKAWIQNKQDLLQARSALKTPGYYWYLGKTYPLEIRTIQKNIIEFEDTFYIASSSVARREAYLTRWYKQEARKVIVERVQHYAKIAKLSYRSIAITSAETRWGSCSSQKTLNFNWRLIMAPPEIIDYVVTHELAHLIELNHSRDFWETVRKMYPLYRSYRTWLKRHGHLLRIE